MKASGHLHAPAAVQQVERPPVPIEWGLGESHCQSERLGGEKFITRAGNRTLYCTAKSLYTLRYPGLYRTSDL
jgi:hypothetical protein